MTTTRTRTSLDFKKIEDLLRKQQLLLEQLEERKRLQKALLEKVARESTSAKGVPWNNNNNNSSDGGNTSSFVDSGIPGVAAAVAAGRLRRRPHRRHQLRKHLHRRRRRHLHLHRHLFHHPHQQ